MGELAPDKASTLAMNAVSQKMVMNERIETRNKIDIFENAFRKIKEATGVSDVNEVIQKIVSQESTTENLISLTRENQGKIEALNELRRKVKMSVEDVKYSGVGGGHRRKMVDDHEDQLSNSAARLERSKLKYERLSKVITAMKAGIGHLQDKLEVVREDVGGKKHELGDDTVAEVLRECELVLNNVVRRIRAGDDDRKRAEMTGFSLSSGGAADKGKGGSSSSSSSSGPGEEITNMSTSRPFNQRINLVSDEIEFAHDDNGGMGGLGDLDDEELTRDKVKRVLSLKLRMMENCFL